MLVAATGVLRAAPRGHAPASMARAAAAGARRGFAAKRSVFDEREDALEKRAVADHDALLLKQLRDKQVAERAAAAKTHAYNVKRVTVVGGGLMGAGIAQVAAAARYDVSLVDVDTVVLNDALARIKKNVSRVAAKRTPDDARAQAAAVDETLARISPSTDVAAAVSDADLVVEAIVENLDAKQALFAQIDAAAPDTAVLASNTSSLSVAAIMRDVRDRSRVGGLHWFNPVPVMRLVEVVHIDETSAATTLTLSKFGESVGKRVIDCKDTPGFVVNRLLVPFLAEAVRLVERGHASVPDTDDAMKLGAAHPMGPFTLCDYVGLDTTYYVLDGWHRAYPDVALFKPPALLKRLVDAGCLGNKSGADVGGFLVGGKPNPRFFDEHGYYKH